MRMIAKSNVVYKLILDFVCLAIAVLMLIFRPNETMGIYAIFGLFMLNNLIPEQILVQDKRSIAEKPKVNEKGIDLLLEELKIPSICRDNYKQLLVEGKNDVFLGLVMEALVLGEEAKNEQQD